MAHELRTLEQLHTFLRLLRAREHLGDREGTGLHLLRQLRLGRVEVRTHPQSHQAPEQEDAELDLLPGDLEPA
ncbi:MAG: hypothetical protein JWR42_802 [Marmoricola sp.]|nr:hypothetical protein [Marmoricola sp.]